MLLILYYTRSPLGAVRAADPHAITMTWGEQPWGKRVTAYVTLSTEVRRESGQERQDTANGWGMPLVWRSWEDRMGDLQGLWPLLLCQGLDESPRQQTLPTVDSGRSGCGSSPVCLHRLSVPT